MTTLETAYKQALKKKELAVLKPGSNSVVAAPNQPTGNKPPPQVEPPVQVQNDSLIGAEFDLSMLPEESFAELIKIIKTEPKPHIVSVAVIQAIIQKDNPAAKSLAGYKLSIGGVERSAFGWRGGVNKEMLIQCITDPAGTPWDLVGTQIDSIWWDTNVLAAVEEDIEETNGKPTGMPTSRNDIYKEIQGYSGHMAMYSANIKSWSKLNGKKRTFSQLKKGELELLWNMCFNSDEASADVPVQDEPEPQQEPESNQQSPVINKPTGTKLSASQVNALMQNMIYTQKSFLSVFDKAPDYETAVQELVDDLWDREDVEAVYNYYRGGSQDSGDSDSFSPLGGKEHLGWDSLDSTSQSLVNKWINAKPNSRNKKKFKKLAKPFHKYDDEDFRLARESRYSIGKLLLEAVAEDDWDLSLLYTLYYHDENIESDPEAMAELQSDPQIQAFMAEEENQNL